MLIHHNKPLAYFVKSFPISCVPEQLSVFRLFYKALHKVICGPHMVSFGFLETLRPKIAIPVLNLAFTAFFISLFSLISSLQGVFGSQC